MFTVKVPLDHQQSLFAKLTTLGHVEALSPTVGLVHADSGVKFKFELTGTDDVQIHITQNVMGIEQDMIKKQVEENVSAILAAIEAPHVAEAEAPPPAAPPSRKR